MKRVAFIDRDGTLNVEKNYVHRIEDFEWIPGSLAALQALSQSHILIYVITNQAGIARGLYTEEDLKLLNQHILEIMQKAQVKIQDILYCPHHPQGSVEQYSITCDCRKPGNALIRKALHQEGLSAKQAVLIGDKNTDIEAGQSLGIPSYLVLTGYGLQEKETTTADFIAKDLKEAVQHFLCPSKPSF